MHFNIDNKTLMAIAGTAATVAIEAIWKPFAKWLAPYVRRIIEERLRRVQKKVYDGKAILSTILLSMENLDHVVSAVQQQTKNGGGLPKAGSPLFGSVVAPAKYSESFRGQLLDGVYLQLIGKLISEKKVMIITEDLPDGCILKDLYQAHEIKAAVWYDMMINKKEYNFISVNLEVPFDKLPAAVKDDIRQLMQTAHDIINA
jgi:hypothetical protein